DDAEHVVPAARVEARGMRPQLVERLFHLEREGQHLHEHGRLDLPMSEVELLLGPVEDLVPESGLAMAFELREVEVRSAAALQEPLRVVEDVEGEVEHGSRDGDAVAWGMSLAEMPGAGSDDQRGGLRT